MEQSEIEVRSISNSPEYNELKKMNDNIFRTMFEEVINKQSENLDVHIEDVEDKIIKKINSQKQSFNKIEVALIKLNDITNEKFESSLKKISSLIDESDLKKSEQVNYLKSEVESNNVRLLKIIEDKEKLQTNQLEKISSLIDESDLKQSEQVDYLKSEVENKNISLLKTIEDKEKLQTNQLEKIANIQSETNKDIERTRTVLEERISAIYEKVSDLDKLRQKTLTEFIDSNNEYLVNIGNNLVEGNKQLEGNLKAANSEQLTIYKENNEVQVNALKKAIIWLMGINLVLAISILIVTLLILL